MKSLPAVIIALVVVAAGECAGRGESVSMEPNVDREVGVCSTWQARGGLVEKCVNEIRQRPLLVALVYSMFPTYFSGRYACSR
jgi:hypothetical protein